MTRFSGSGPGALVALGLGLSLLSGPLGAPRAQPAGEQEEEAPIGEEPSEGEEGMREAPPPTADEQYDIKVRELEEKVVNLKEKIFRSKTRLLLLKERILNDVIAEAKLVIHHVDDMGGSFEPVQVYYRLDGEDLKLLDNATGLLNTDEPIEIFSGNVAPGNHNLTVEMVFRGDSAVFSYLKDYLFKLRANYTFYATKGKVTTVRSVGYLKGDITHDLTERPSIKFSVSQKSYTKEALETPEAREGEGGSE
ncbi:MAG: dihydrolipoamide acetyltransferase [Myxococcota bacterium]